MFRVGRHAGHLPPLAECTPGETGTTSVPGGRAAALVHLGPYDGLPAAYRLLDQWCRERRLATAGAPWESYVDRPDHMPHEALRTEVVFPLAGDT